VQRERENGEHHDGPGARRAHDPAIVDAHLQALTAETQALARASAALHDRVRAMEGELNALTLSLRAGAEEPAAPRAEERSEAVPPALVSAAEGEREAAPTTPVAANAAPTYPAAAEAAPTPPAAAGAGEQKRSDLDGARLVALNMALSGESREQADRHLADSFELADRAKLLDEVYAAVEG
jgi:DNA polymerase III gamma/tau subunit